MQCSKKTTLSMRPSSGWKAEAERRGGFYIEDQLNFYRLLD
jgi:hypothetical protein